jgi:hypothetical protein
VEGYQSTTKGVTVVNFDIFVARLLHQLISDAIQLNDEYKFIYL